MRTKSDFGITRYQDRDLGSRIDHLEHTWLECILALALPDVLISPSQNKAPWLLHHQCAGCCVIGQFKIFLISGRETLILTSGKIKVRIAGKCNIFSAENWQQLFFSHNFLPQNEGNYPENADPLHIAMHIACWHKIIRLLGMALAAVRCTLKCIAENNSHLEYNTTLNNT